jgi:Bifunctional DNA primase/polymerase, N-terminal
MLLKAVLAYACRGVPVFPCEPRGKAPLTYSGFWDATTDAGRIEAWWDRWPYANVGVPTGERSGLLVLDVDPRDGGPESLLALERINGPLPETAKARTGGGGVHVFFRYPAGGTRQGKRCATAPVGWGRAWMSGGWAATSSCRRAARKAPTNGSPVRPLQTQRGSSSV